ncbi:MAG TPA: DUF4404 family protein [Polyangiales bacterium]|nr:DUF4404 family protein [Polyangiales bacterium]
MPDKRLHELVVELDQTLRAGGAISAEDRALLERVHRELEATLARPSSPQPPPTLRGNLRTALERVQAEHPRLSGLLSATLDALSDLGV